MNRPERNPTVELVVVASGHKRMEKQATAALEGAGFTILTEGHPRHQTDDYGLSSYTDPIAADKAGKPNSGHTPGTPHPDALRHLVQENDHEAGCTRLSVLEWIDQNRDWVPKVTRIKVGVDEKKKPIYQELVEQIEPEDPRLHLPCEHIGTTEWRGRSSKHVGEPYERDDRITFIGAAVQVAPTPEAMNKAIAKSMEAVEPLGWMHRMASETQPQRPKPTTEERLVAQGFTEKQAGTLAGLIGED